ncbi:stage III sporulation protein AF [Clostridium sp. CAG:245]|jgi:stage III sporulation protein AF|nr:stage III sporulation protein AF [Clostridium sp. CAG:245]
MIEFLSSWAQGIIVAVIIATLIEMILPNSSSKKYVKVVIGMYILFTIVSPIIKKLGGKDINLNTINIEKYEQQISKSDNTISRKFEDNNTRSIKDIYVSNLKADISAKLKEKGYEIDTSDIQIKDDENYTIEKITLKLIKMEQKQGKNNEIVINTVEIGNTISQKDSKTLSDDDKQEVKDYISETYDIDKKNINIS